MYRFSSTLCVIVAIALSTSTAIAAEKAKPAKAFVMKHNLDENGAPLFDAAPVEQKGWRPADFIGKGNIEVIDGEAIIGKGNDMTGITWRGPLVRMNYEITLEAKRVEGNDFFCGLTFPYGPDPCSLILGGWGGSLVGLSSLDGQDAANNETTTHRDFEQNRWYKVRLRVTPDKIQAWVDDDQLVDVKTEKRKIGIRWEVEESVPLGIATWQTTGAIRNVELRAFRPES